MQNRGRLVACDLMQERLDLIAQNSQRLGITCAEQILLRNLGPGTAANGSKPAGTPTFDRILVDVPCSNTGVMRRRVELRWRIRAEEIQRLCRTQTDLLNQAADRLKPGGVLVYSTCSLEPEENEMVVQAFLTRHRQFRLERERQLLPFVDGVDGAYVARLVMDGKQGAGS
jgi:16S rRNA (cytosine967-C5)-methyltransferase